MGRICIALLLLLAACASRPTSASSLPPALLRFVEASRFVPPGMLSFMLLQRPDPYGDPAVDRIEVWAGRDFEKPKGVGFGAFRDVVIEDLGPGGIEPPYLPYGTPEPAIAGSPCWFSPEEVKFTRFWSPPTWRAVVDHRFLVTTNDRDMLVAALLRTGELDALLHGFGDLSFLAPESRDFIFNLPRPGDLADWGRPVPDGRMIFVDVPGPWRLRIYREHPLTRDHIESVNLVGKPGSLATEHAGEWWRDDIELRLPAPLHAQVSAGLLLVPCFGQFVFL